MWVTNNRADLENLLKNATSSDLQKLTLINTDEKIVNLLKIIQSEPVPFKELNYYITKYSTNYGMKYFKYKQKYLNLKKMYNID